MFIVYEEDLLLPAVLWMLLLLVLVVVLHKEIGCIYIDDADFLYIDTTWSFNCLTIGILRYINPFRTKRNNKICIEFY
jgi:hypothetical protein